MQNPLPEYAREGSATQRVGLAWQPQVWWGLLFLGAGCVRWIGMSGGFWEEEKIVA